MQVEQMEAEVEAQQDQYDMLTEMTGYEYQFNELTQSWEQVMGENPMTGMPMDPNAPAPGEPAQAMAAPPTPKDPEITPPKGGDF